MNFWDSQYRRIWLPYVVRQCGQQKNPKVCAIMNRNYHPLSHVESVSYSTGTECGQETKNLFGSVVRFKTDPDKFKELKKIGLSLGFRIVESGPLVRSSYHAEKHLI